MLAFRCKEENNRHMNENKPESVSLVKYPEFAQDPEAIIDKSNATGEPVVVTSKGRFAFLIEPLDVQASASDVDTLE